MMLSRRWYLLILSMVVSACGSAPAPCVPTISGDVVYVVGQGWHAEIGIPVEELDDHLAFYRKVFTGAHVIMFGYGKKTFITAPPETISEYILGPVPGPAVIHAVALSVTPLEAYPPEHTTMLVLPKGGARALSEYIWNDLVKDPSGKPHIVSRSSDPDGLFYAAKSEYSLLHTCNTWAADALHASGLAVSGKRVIFSNQVMTQAIEAVSDQCSTLLRN